MLTVYVSIGNSDNKLTQKQWATFHQLVADALRREATRVHGEWMSSPVAPWQNACWCVQLEPGRRAEQLKDDLGRLARTFHQDSIAWALAPETEFLCSAG